MTLERRRATDLNSKDNFAVLVRLETKVDALPQQFTQMQNEISSLRSSFATELTSLKESKVDTNQFNDLKQSISSEFRDLKQAFDSDGKAYIRKEEFDGFKTSMVGKFDGQTWWYRAFAGAAISSLVAALAALLLK